MITIRTMILAVIALGLVGCVYEERSGRGEHYSEGHHGGGYSHEHGSYYQPHYWR